MDCSLRGLDDDMITGIKSVVTIAIVASIVSTVFWLQEVRADDTQRGTATAEQTKTQVRGRVVMESDGKPVTGADVRLVTWTDNGRRYNTNKTRSDIGGEFVFDEVGTGKHQLVAFFEDFASRQSRYKGAPVDPALQQPVTLALSKMPRIAVHVVSKADAKPVAGALVRLVWSDSEGDQQTDASGSALMRQLTHEVWHVKVKAKGFAAKEEAVNLAGTETANVTFELEPGGVLFGTVKDEEGNNLTEAGLSVFPANHSGPQIEYMTTDFKGGFRFDGLPLDKGLELSISKKGFIETRQQLALTGGDTEHELNIVLKRRPHGGAIRGTVTDIDGKPIASATITNRGNSSRDQRKATTDQHGQFMLDDVYAQYTGHEMIIKAKGYAPQRKAFTPGSKEKPAEFAIKLESGHRIRGLVLDGTGKPIAGVRVYHSDGNRGGGFEFGDGTTSDANGKFEFDSLPSNAPFSFDADGYSEIEEAKLPLDGKDEVVVTIQPDGVIRGKVMDAVTQKPISPFNVRLTFSPDRSPAEPGHHLGGARATTPAGEQFANPEGTFLLKDLIYNMPLQLTVSAEGFEDQVYRRVVAKSKTEADEIVVPLHPLDVSKLFAIRGRIIDSQGKPVIGAELRLITVHKVKQPRRPRAFISSDEFPFNWQMIRSGQVSQVDGVSQFISATSGKDGAFAFERIRPAIAMEIAYWRKGISQARVEHIEKLSVEELGNVAIDAITPGIIRGTIDRQALSDVTSLRLNAAESPIYFDYQYAELSADRASYEFRDIPPGKYELTVNGETIRNQLGGFSNTILQRHAVEVRTGETVTLDIAASK